MIKRRKRKDKKRKEGWPKEKVMIKRWKNKIKEERMRKSFKKKKIWKKGKMKKTKQQQQRMEKRREKINESCSDFCFDLVKPFPFVNKLIILNRNKKGSKDTFFFSFWVIWTLPYYLLIAGGRVVGFIFFANVLGVCEMQSASSRSGTKVTASLSFSFSLSLSLSIYIYIYI